jgi:probable rRNA maturation factor
MDPDHSTPGLDIAVIVADPAWHRLVPGLKRWVSRAAAQLDIPAAITLTSDRAIQRLNALHRGRNKPTNVLTYDPPHPAMPGEILLGRETVAREARAARKRPAHHLAHLVIHGLLHLAGHDHDHAGEARRMEMLETRLLHRLGVPDPWRAR